jgi:hypothetical protein
LFSARTSPAGRNGRHKKILSGSLSTPRTAIARKLVRGICPPGERYATQFGLSYPVRCANETHWRLQRNILFIHDYLHGDPEAIEGRRRERILACVRMAPVISLADLIQQTTEFATADDIYLLIASGRLYVDLYAEPLVDPAKSYPPRSHPESTVGDIRPRERPQAVPRHSWGTHRGVVRGSERGEPAA